MTSDVGINIEVKSVGSGAKTIKRDLDNIATSGNKAVTSSKNVETAYEKLQARADSAAKRLRDLALAGETSGKRFERLSNQTRSYNDRLREADAAVRKATGATKSLEKQIGATSRATTALTRAVTGLMAAYGLRALALFSDNITTLETQLKNVTKSTEDYTRKFDALFKIAQSTGDAFGDLTGNFVRLNSSLPDSIKNTTDLTKVTELLSRGFAASGANAQAAGAVMTQLTQGLAGNFANASQEINSLIEGTPLLAKIIAEQLGGKAATDLKKFAEEGKLTTQSFLAALLASEEAIKAYEIPPTIGRSLQRIRNEFVRLGSQSAVLEGASASLARVLDTVADNLLNIIKILGVLIASTLPLLIRQLAISLPAALAATTTAVTALTVAIGLNPLGAIAIGVSAAVSALFLFRKEIFEALDDVKVFGLDATDTMFFIKNTAIEVFGALADTITLPFRIALEVFKSTIAQLKIAANTIPKVNIPVSAEERTLAGQNALQIAARLGSGTLNRNAGIGQRIQQATNEDMENFAKRAKEAVPPVKSVADILQDVSVTTKTIDDNISKLADKVKTGGEVNDAFKELSNDIERDFSVAFKDAFTNTEGVFDRFISGMKSTFLNFLGEIAYQAAARPILLSLGVAGGTALGGGAASAGGLGSIIGGGSGGGFGLGNIGSLFSSGFSALTSGLSTPIFSAGSMIGSGINSIGASLGLTNANFIGPIMPGASSLASAFTPMAGLAGFGGNMLANLLFGGDRGIGASIGGIAGGIGGTAIGASMGTILGMAGGPVGALIGAFAGNALGGLFGGGKPRTTLGIGLTPNQQGMFTTFGASNKGASNQQAIEFGNAVSQSLNAIIAASGGRAGRAFGLETNIGSKDPKTVFDKRIISGSSGDIDAIVNEALRGGFITGLSPLVQQVLDASIGKSTNTIVENLGIAALIQSFEDVAEVTNPLKDALDALDAQFGNLKTRAMELGLPIDKLTESYDAQRQAIISQSLAPLQEFLDAQALSGTSSLSAVERLSLSRSAFDKNLSAIQAGDLSGLGSITNQASQLLGLGREVFASGAGFNALESFVRQSITGIGEQLGGEGALNDSIAREITLSNAQQTSIMQQMLVELEELRKENKELRKAMERVGNSLNA